MPLSRENTVLVIGTLESNNLVKDVSSNPKVGPYIRGNMIIKVTSPKVMSIPITYFASVNTQEGKPRKLYGQLESLRNNQRISITAHIQDNKFWDTSRGQLVKTKRLTLDYINAIKAEENDKAEFIFSGFVAETLKEVHDKDENLTSYTIKLAQSDYKQTRAEVIGFVVDPNDVRAVNFIAREYTGGKTVKVSGQLDYDVKTETRTEEVDFGQPVVKTYQRTISNLVITGGVAVTEGVYEQQDRDLLLNGDAANDKQVEADAKGKEKSGAAVSTNKPLQANTNTGTSLL